MKEAMLYIHGRGGSPAEAARFQTPEIPVIGVELSSPLPWENKDTIRSAYERLRRQHDAVSVIANSIGAYFAMNALWEADVARAFFMSPIVDMERLIRDLMALAHVTEEALRQRREIPTDLGETLSWPYLQYVRAHPIRWTVPTEILYAGGDCLTAPETIRAFAVSHRAGITVLEEGEHWFHTESQLAFLDRWFRSLL